MGFSFKDFPAFYRGTYLFVGPLLWEGSRENWKTIITIIIWLDNLYLWCKWLQSNVIFMTQCQTFKAYKDCIYHWERFKVLLQNIEGGRTIEVKECEKEIIWLIL